MASDREYKDMKVFVEGDDGKKRPVQIGYAYEDGGKLRFQITALPPPGARTNWSGLIESRDDRGGAQRSSSSGGGNQRGNGRGDSPEDY
ncbi:MAG: hypothetical protein KBD62_37325 [Kofleriaceae bacterium]|nr:hypothetical protein [Kofleriaceae bacterium]